MNSMPLGTGHVRPSAPAVLQDPRAVLGAFAVLVWFIALTATDFAYDVLGVGEASGAAHPAAYAVHELAAGYVLGFVAAIAAALLGGLLRGNYIEALADRAWLRRLMMVGLFVVVLACVAGAAVHNADGVTFLYDMAFAVGLVVVFAGVVPLHRHLQAGRED